MSEYVGNGNGEMGSRGAGRAAVRVARGEDLPRFEILPGVEIAPLAGARMNLNVVTLAPGAVAPVHTHEEEQIGYVVSGGCVFEDGERFWTLGPGDVYHAPGGVPHGARALEEGCVILDCFSPPRAEVLRLLGEAGD